MVTDTRSYIVNSISLQISYFKWIYHTI